MSRDDDTPIESQVTTDQDSIERWADEHDAVPVRRQRGDEEVVELVPESDRHESHEELQWDEFHREIDERDKVVAYREDQGDFIVMRRDEMMQQPHVETDEVEDALLDGETVTATVTETTVVEQTIVEEATIESEVVDQQVVQETPVDAELISREVADCQVTDVDEAGMDVDYDMFESGYEGTANVDVAVEVDEAWTVTWEILEELIIESRVVDTEATETDTVETDTLEETVDVRGVQETILQSDMLDAQTDADQVIDSGGIESEFQEGDYIETTLLQRSTVEDEMSVHKEYTGTADAATTTTAETISTQTVESSIAEDEDLGMAGDTDLTRTAGDEPAAAETQTTGTEVTDTAVDEPPTAAPTPTKEDEGKTVVDATGDEVGMVTDVEGSTLYVDPSPSLTDRIRTALDWGSHGDEDYQLGANQIDQITDDEIRLEVEE